MIRNYLKIAWRNLSRNVLYSWISIGGLAVGMTVSFILLLYVYNEYSYDRFHENKEQLYKVLVNQPSNNQIETGSSTPVQTAQAVLKDFPEIEKAAVTQWAYPRLYSYKDQSVNLVTQAADPSLLDMFTFSFVSGNKQGVFSSPFSVILTESAAKILFGKEDAMGKTLKMNKKHLVKVTAIIKDPPVNSDFQMKVLIPWSLQEIDQPWLKESNWGNYSFVTYVQLKKGTDPSRVNARLKGLIARYDSFNKQNELFLYPFSKVHLYGRFENGVNAGGAIESLRLFFFLALGILLIACINFMNLSTARSAKRAREVGIRKVVGAVRGSLIYQFLGESVLLAFIALLLALLLLALLLPRFNQLSQLQLFIPWNDYHIWLAITGLTLFTGLVAGSYPALFLSGFKPVRVLKGMVNSGKTSLRPRQLLVIIQFAFATAMIMSSLIIYKQLLYIKNRPVGYEKNGLIELTLNGTEVNFENFRRDAIASGAATEGVFTSSTISHDGSSGWGLTWPGQLPGEENIHFDQMATMYHFTSAFGIKILQGRDFSESSPSDSTAILLNEAAVKLMRLKQPLGALVKWQGENRRVVGVIGNFTWGSPYEPVKPLVVGFNKDWVTTASMRLNPALPVSESLARIRKIYKTYDPASPFEYNFVDDNFNKKFRSEQLLGLIAGWFTGLAILISGLGLFALASFASEQRRKEIGIRKVLGAGIVRLWCNLSAEFIGLVFIAFLIGAAAAGYFMNSWLQKYTYHTQIGTGVFILTIGATVIICLLTVSYQAIRAAAMNPAKSLRTE